MPRPTKTDPRIARHRREIALGRAELRGPSHPRTPAAGVISFPLKAKDPATERMVQEFLAARRQA